MIESGLEMPRRIYARSPRMRRASWMSLGMMVTRLAWMAQRLVSSKSRRGTPRTPLEGEDGGGLEAEVRLEVLGDLADEAEGELADKELGGLLVLADLTESDGTGTISGGAS